ncbi:MAG: hypothetical protein HY365_03460 [Candidatus Aenigmarchaeota archaeon]|nr:hypothetical protein [Candidatus Aenigmarchaeota archaeon]
MLGQNPLLSHVFAIGLSLAIIGVVIYVTSSLNEQYTTFVAEQEVSQVCSIIRSAAGKTTAGEHLSLNDTIIAKITVNLPAKIANEPYRVRFIGKNASIETLSANVTCVLGYNATYRGSVPGGRASVSWTADKNGASIVELSG